MYPPHMLTPTPTLARPPAALAAVKRAVRADPARTQRCTMSAAKTEYRLSDKDLKVRCVAGWACRKGRQAGSLWRDDCCMPELTLVQA